MSDAVDRAQTAANLIERIGMRIPGFRGYLEREARREVDQMVRAQLAGRLDQARAAVAGHARTLTLAAGGPLARLSALDKRLDRVANTLRHAGSGYAGLFDAVKVRGEELETLYRFDLSLVESVDAVESGAARLKTTEDSLAALENLVVTLDGCVAGRDAVIRSVFSAAGRVK